MTGCLDPSPQIDLEWIGTFPAQRALQATPILSPDGGNHLENRSNGMFAPGYDLAASGVFPSSPRDAQQAWISLGGQSWTFRYHAASSFTNKWEFIGGAPLYANREQQGTIAPAGGDSWADLSGTDVAGPDVTVPSTGVYLVRFGAGMIPGSNGSRARVGVSVGAGNDPTNDNVATVSNTAAGLLSSATAVSREIQVSCASGTRLRLLYGDGGSSGTAAFQRRWISVIPLRCG